MRERSESEVTRSSSAAGAEGPPRNADWRNNKWLRLGIFILPSFFTSALYYGWQQYQRMLFQDGAYAWLCAAGEECKAQEDAITRLSSIAGGCEYASAAIGGLFLDHLGPRKSGFIGEVCWAIGTILLALSTRSFQAYIPAMIIIGSSVNVVCFPALTTIEQFPEWKGLMVSIVLAAQNAATGIPPILYAIMKRTGCRLRTIWLVYLACIWIPVTIAYLVFLPSKRDFKDILALQRKELLEHEEGQQLLEGGVADTNSENVTIIEGKASWQDFLSCLTNLDMVLMAIYFATMMLLYAYYPTVVVYAVSDAVSDYMGYFMPTQAVWALVAGLLADYLNTAYLMLGMCLSLEIVFILTLAASEHTWLHYVACTLLIITQCAIFEIKYTYVAEMFDPYNFGKLVGFLGIVGGCATFLNIPVAADTNYRRTFIIYCILIPFLALIAGFLRWRQVRGVTYKTMPETEKKPDAVAVSV